MSKDLHALKIRRITQIVKDCSIGNKVLDLACGHGIYSLELARQGYQVSATDGRMYRMQKAIDVSKNEGLNINFKLEDIRNLEKGNYDTVLLLGILYHLDHKSIHPLLKRIYDMSDLLVIDTHISIYPNEIVRIGNSEYEGENIREHREGATKEEKEKALLMSLDNEFSFWFSKESLFQLLADVGYTTVSECLVPIEPNKPKNRITVIARKGNPINLTSFEWINDISDKEIKEICKEPAKEKTPIKQGKLHPINKLLKIFGIKVSKIKSK